MARRYLVSQLYLPHERSETGAPGRLIQDMRIADHFAPGSAWAFQAGAAFTIARIANAKVESLRQEVAETTRKLRPLSDRELEVARLYHVLGDSAGQAHSLRRCVRHHWFDLGPGETPGVPLAEIHDTPFGPGRNDHDG